MFIRDIMAARSQLAMQREAVRILTAIMDRLNVNPSPDGDTYRCSFNIDAEFLDRLGVWGAAEAELEDGDIDTDGRDDCEADARRLQPLREAPAEVPDIFKLITDPPMAMPAPRLVVDNDTSEADEPAPEDGVPMSKQG